VCVCPVWVAVMYVYNGLVTGYVSVPRGGHPGFRGVLNRVWRACTASTVRLGIRIIKQNLYLRFF